MKMDIEPSSPGGGGKLRECSVTSSSAGPSKKVSLNQLIEESYDELLRAARRLCASGGSCEMPRIILHEAWLKLSTSGSSRDLDRAHAKALLVRTMRQVLIDEVRRGATQKRGGAWNAVELQEPPQDPWPAVDAELGVHGALDQLASQDPRLAEALSCRFLRGMTEAETARTLGVSARTVERVCKRACMRLRMLMVEGSTRAEGGRETVNAPGRDRCPVGA